MFRRLLVYTLLSCLALSACHSGRTVADAGRPVVTGDQLLFLNYRVFAQGYGSVGTRLLSHKVVAGRLKDIAHADTDPTPGDLQCVLLDASGQVVRLQRIENPLEQEVEFVNDDGHLERRIVQQDSAIISLRLPLPAATRSVALEHLAGNGKPNRLHLLSIE